MTHIEKVREKIKETRQLCQALTGIGDDSYNAFFYELGCAWALDFTKESKSATYLTQQREFWGFWLLNYSQAEDRWLEMVKYDSLTESFTITMDDCIIYTEQQGIALNYTLYMDAEMMDCRTNSVILEKSFDHLIVKGNG